MRKRSEPIRLLEAVARCKGPYLLVHYFLRAGTTLKVVVSQLPNEFCPQGHLYWWVFPWLVFGGTFLGSSTHSRFAQSPNHNSCPCGVVPFLRTPPNPKKQGRIWCPFGFPLNTNPKTGSEVRTKRDAGHRVAEGRAAPGRARPGLSAGSLRGLFAGGFVGPRGSCDRWGMWWNEPVLGGIPKKGKQLGWMAYFRNEPVLGIPKLKETQLG